MAAELAGGGRGQGVIAHYRAYLPVTDATPVVTLGEGDTPLVAAPHLGAALGVELYLKLEGVNPTCSFKDRGMTMAVTKVVEEGFKAVICASTGNTSASAAAYAAKAGIRAIVVIPEGKIAMGKLAQAVAYGAHVVSIPGNFDVALDVVRAAAARPAHRPGQLGQPLPHRGPEDRRLRDLRRPRRPARLPLHPGGQRRQHHELLEGLPRVPRGRRHRPPARDVRLSGGRRGAARAGPQGRGARDHRHRHPHRQPGARRRSARRARTTRAASSTRSPTTRSSPPTSSWRPPRASSASRRARPRSRA